jgi:hypothetical protein
MSPDWQTLISGTYRRATPAAEGFVGDMNPAAVRRLRIVWRH